MAIDTIKIKLQGPNDLVNTIRYQTIGSSGFDIPSNSNLTIYPGETILVDTGLFFQIPMGYELQIRSRSGLAAKHGIAVLNSPGTVDSDYRGEVKVILINHGQQSFGIKRGDRVAQGVFQKIYLGNFEIVDQIEQDTSRGINGFGSTGITTTQQIPGQYGSIGERIQHKVLSKVISFVDKIKKS